MKKILLLFLVVSSFGFAQVNNYSVGQTVANFTVTDTDGNTHSLYDITASGKYVFVDFFFTTCVPCQTTQKYFNELHDKYGCNEGEIYTLSISGYAADNDIKVINFENTYGGPFKHSPAVSPEGGGAAVVSQFGINAFPTYCLIGPDNKLVNKDIYPIYNVGTFENAFPAGFAPDPMECTDGEMGVSDLSFNEVNIYPSVTNGPLYIALNKAGQTSISVFNMEGKEVFKTTANQKEIQLDLKLAAGVYIVRIQTEDKRVETKRFVIK